MNIDDDLVIGDWVTGVRRLFSGATEASVNGGQQLRPRLHPHALSKYL